MLHVNAIIHNLPRVVKCKFFFSMDLAAIKTLLPLSQILQHYGLRPDKQNMLCCPFHDDKTPSMQVYPETGTVYCFSSNCKLQGKAIDVIDFVMYMEGCSKHEAILQAQKLIPSAEAAAARKKPANQKPESPPDYEAIFAKLQAALSRSKTALAYLKSRCLDPDRLEIGYNSGRSYKALKNCVVFPLKNADGDIVSLYGRAVGKAGKHYYSANRKGLYPGYPPETAERLILTESVIDAATLQLSITDDQCSILALYGTNGLTDEHRHAIQSLNSLQEIIFFFDGDEAGEKAVKKYANELSALLPKVKLSQVLTPEGEDINSLVQGHEEEVFTALLETRQALFLSDEKKSPDPQHPAHPANSSVSEDPVNPVNPVPNNPLLSVLDTENPNRLTCQGEAARYQILGGLGKSLDSLKVTLSIQHNNQRSRQKLDLYEDQQIEKAARRAGDKLGIRADQIERALNQLTDLLDEYRENLPSEGEAQQEKEPPGSPIELKAADTLLKEPKLMRKLSEKLKAAGVVGEERNAIITFSCAAG